MVKNSRTKIPSRKVSLIEKRTKWILAISFFTLLLLIVIAALLSYPDLRNKIVESTSGILYSPTGASTTVASSLSTTGSTGSTGTTATSTGSTGSTTAAVTSTSTSTSSTGTTSTSTGTTSTSTGTTSTTTTPSTTTSGSTGTTTSNPTTTTPSSTPTSTTTVPTFPTLSVCGNGFVERGEICDPSHILKQLGYACTTSTITGSSSTSSGVKFCIMSGTNACKSFTPCTIRSTAQVCGNGKVEGVEGCDDGNVISGDGCSATCSSEEQARIPVFCSADSAMCADGSEVSRNNNDNCNWYPCEDGSIPGVCGDGEKNGYKEQCDKGDLLNGVLCDNTNGPCSYCDSSCINQIIQKKQAVECEADVLYCADGSTVVRDKNNNCEFLSCEDGSVPTKERIEQVAEICGDGIVQINLGEECDGSSFGENSDQCNEFDAKFDKGRLTCDTSCKINVDSCQLQKKNTRYEIKGGEKLNPEEYATISDVLWGDVITYFIEGPNGENEEHTITVKTGRGAEGNKRASVDLIFKSDEFLETFEDGDVKTLNVGGKDEQDDILVGVESVNADEGTSTITIALMSEELLQQEENPENLETSPQDQQFTGAANTLQQIIQKGNPTTFSSKPVTQNLYKVLFAVITVLAILVIFVFTRLAGTLHNQQYPQ